jgi:hypothetical protein
MLIQYNNGYCHLNNNKWDEFIRKIEKCYHQENDFLLELYNKVTKLYDIILSLYSDPNGVFTKFDFPATEYFAIFGPFWLPIIAPLYRSYKAFML